MGARDLDVVAAGHICVDITPVFPKPVGPHGFMPGRLYRAGPAIIADGGSVANTGLALHRFGNRVAAVAKIGPDEMGLVCRRYMARYGLDAYIKTGEGLTTSYSVVVSPPGSDRFFIHHPGANESFLAEDVPDDLLPRARLLHLGYPTLMESLYRDEGEETYKLLARAKDHGLLTSMDVALMDPDTEAAAQDWPRIMKRLAPVLDIFLPSYEELYEMLDFRGYLAARARTGGADMEEAAIGEHALALASALAGMGIGVIGVKCGLRGIHLATGAPAVLDESWRHRRLWASALRISPVVSATGAGDCAIAGFLTAILRELGPMEAISAACVTGAQNVRAADAYSGLGDWDEVMDMMGPSQPRVDRPPGPMWRETEVPGVWSGPGDAA